MSNYPSWWSTTITVYNKYTNTETQEVGWKRTVLTNCFMTVARELTTINKGASQAYRNIIVCRIPKNSNYVDAYSWSTDVAQTSKFTLQDGDIIVKGKITDEIDEYTKGSRATDLVDKYKAKGVFRIGMMQDNSDSVRNLPHYYVTE